MIKQKFILIWVVVIIVVLGGGICGFYLWQKLNQPLQESSSPNVILTSLVKGCAETDEGMATKSFAAGTEQAPSLEVRGREIIYTRSLNHLCCRKADLEKAMQGSVINIYEVWSGIGCKCICFSEIGANLQNVSPGTYTVNIYEKGTKPGNEGLMEQKSILSRNILVK